MSGKPTPAELAVAAQDFQRLIDGEVTMAEWALYTSICDPVTRRGLRAKLVVAERLSKSLARIIAAGAPERASC